MSRVKQDSLFCSLPLELIFHIFRHLDAQTIVRSFRLVCKQFHTIVNIYDQFHFDFTSILKCDFHCLCNLILPTNVKSLILSDDNETPGQIGYFLSRFRLKQFHHLHSLTLHDIDDCHLSIILKDITTLSLQSLLIDSQQDYSQNQSITNDLLPVISLATLEKVHLHLPGLDILRMTWPLECTIQHLDIYCRSLDDYCHILYHLPHLRIFVVERLNMTNHLDGILPELTDVMPSCQLVSLTLKYCDIDMDIFQFLLALTPTLEHLRLMRSIDLHVFISHLSQWQKFVETQLLLLTRFEFFLTESTNFFVPSVNTEELIAPFQTSFWSEVKRWFVICDHIINPRTVILRSPSIYDPRFQHVFVSKQIMCAASVPTINKTVTMDGIRKLRLDLTTVMSIATSSQGGLPSKPIFPKLDELTLCMRDYWQQTSLRFISTLIDLSHLNKLSLVIYGSFTYRMDTISSIALLLKLAHHLRSLKLMISPGYGFINDSHMNLCSVIPDHVRHLTISVSTLDQMSMVIKMLKHRSSIRFEYINNYWSQTDLHIQWFKRENGYYTYRLNESSLSMWFDKCVNTSFEPTLDKLI